MEYKYKKDQFLRNKISGAVVKIFADTNKIDLNIWEIWNPIEGELCWFWNNGTKYPILSRLVMINDYDGFYNNDFNAETPWYSIGDAFDDYKIQESYDYKFCAPVTTTLPLELGLIR